MKGSKILFIGGLVVVGVVAYELYKHYHSAKDTFNTSPKDEDYASPMQKDSSMVYSFEEPDSDTFETKEAVVASVKERHYEAARVMEESLNTIFKENSEEEIVSENSDALNQTSNDLNDLLK